MGSTILVSLPWEDSSNTQTRRTTFAPGPGAFHVSAGPNSTEACLGDLGDL